MYPRILCFEKKRGPVRAVEGAVRRVNLWLKRSEQMEEVESDPSQDDVVTTTAIQPTRPKVLLRVRTRCSTKLRVSSQRTVLAMRASS